MGYSTGNIIVTTLHVICAILSVGGVAFLRFVALPFSESLSDEEKQRFQLTLRKRFVPILHTSFLLLILTGIHHITRLIRGGMAIPTPLVVKMILALIIIFIGVALTIPKGFDALKNKKKSWLSFNLLLAVIVVYLGVSITHG
ncbi:MAG: hypothetical protein VX794_02575 [Nitrospinota bacterium]|nr:hypothetical protein [Nitrospinota bacterium]